MAGSPFFNNFPLVFWCLTGLDIQSRRFSLVWISCAVVTCSTSFITSVYRAFSKDFSNEIVHGTTYLTPIIVLFLLSITVLIMKRDQIIVLIESVLMPLASYKSCSLHSKTMKEYERWIHRIGMFMVVNAFIVMCCIMVSLGPLLVVFFIVDEDTAIQDFPLPYGWIPFPTDSYLVYATAYIIGASTAILGGGVAVGVYLLFIFSVMGVRTMLKLLAEDWTDFIIREDELISRILDLDASTYQRQMDEAAKNMVRLNCIKRFLNESVEKHVQIIRSVKTLNNCFSIYNLVFCKLIIFMGALCIPRLITKPDFADRDYLFVGNMIFAVFVCIAVMCYCGQVIIDEAENLQLVLYEFRWVDRHPSFQGGLLIMMTVATRPLHLKVGGAWPLTMETFGNVMEGVYSYVNFLFTLKNKPV